MKKYEAMDGLKAFSAIGIVMMHVLLNGQYPIPGWIGSTFIPSLTNLVFLFMAASAFGLCCGYYERFRNGSIDLETFYKNRFRKILPFFALLSVIDVILSPGQSALFELFANLTLMFGLLPNAHIQVIGVGWFIGVIFVFYLLFPFFTTLLKTKLRSWCALAVAVIYNLLCQHYFFDRHHVVDNFSGKSNIVFCFMFFMAGGLIYLYKDKLENLSPWIGAAVLAVTIAAFYLLGQHAVLCLLVSAALLAYAVMRSGRRSLLQNKVTAFLSGISMEIYLCHMLFFRILERIGLTHLTGNGIVAYLLTLVFILLLSILFSYFVQQLIQKLLDRRKTA